MKRRKKSVREYIITYRSREHYEVLGWVRASSPGEAVARARSELKNEIARYSVVNAVAAEWNCARAVRLNP